MDFRGERDFQKLAEQFCSRNERPPKNSTMCAMKPSTTRKCETVVNLNQTVNVQEPNLWPYSAHGYLKFKNSAGQNVLGSGTLIGPNIVLTAAHNLYDRRTNQNYTDIRFYSSSPRGYVENRIVRGVFPESYKRLESEDYGIVILSKNVGNETGFYGISFLNDSDLAYKKIHLAGFPSEHNGNLMRTCTKNVASSTSDKVTYMFGSLGGESGSCIWYTEGETCLVAGVHVLTSTTHNMESAVSTATFINAERYENIRNWVIGNCRNLNQIEESKVPIPVPAKAPAAKAPAPAPVPAKAPAPVPAKAPAPVPAKAPAPVPVPAKAPAPVPAKAPAPVPAKAPAPVPAKAPVPAPAPVGRSQIIVCNKGHQLEFESSIHRNCNCCREDKVNAFKRCKPCDFDMCMSCEQCIILSAPLANNAKCANRHPLVWDPLRLGRILQSNPSLSSCTINCDSCGLKTMAGSFTCKDCNYDICTKCIPRKIQR